MIKLFLLIASCYLYVFALQAQNNHGIHFQGIARSETGMIVANKQITLRISIVNDSSLADIEYQEIKSVRTNVLGLFYTNIGLNENGKVVTIGNFDDILWEDNEKYLQIELDPNNALQFLSAGIEKIHYVPFALYAKKAKTIVDILPVTLGGTGFKNVLDVVKSYGLDKVSNTTDSLKPISMATALLLNEKLKKSDTLSLSNRINQKLNSIDTLKLITKINLKLNSADTLNLSSRIQNIKKSSYAVFYDTAKQNASSSTATAVKFNFQQAAHKIKINKNTAGNPTKITVTENGLYQLHYQFQLIKPDAGNDEAHVWIRRNGSAYPNSTLSYLIAGTGFKNNIAGNYFIDLNANDYIELFFAIKNNNSSLTGTVASTATPSKPATPSASITIHSVD
jgi:hypothetical protein